MPKTFTKQSMPWGLYAKNGSRLLCSDGVIRAAELAETADTFFSVPASIRIKGKRVTGYYTGEEQQWIKGVKESGFLDCRSFHNHDGQEWAGLPDWDPYGNPAKHNALIESAQ